MANAVVDARDGYEHPRARDDRAPAGAISGSGLREVANGAEAFRHALRRYLEECGAEDGGAATEAVLRELADLARYSLRLPECAVRALMALEEPAPQPNVSPQWCGASNTR